MSLIADASTNKQTDRRRYEYDSDYEPPSNPIIKSYVLPKRPALGTKGNPTKVAVNAYPVLKFPTSAIHQYDVWSHSFLLPLFFWAWKVLNLTTNFCLLC